MWGSSGRQGLMSLVWGTVAHGMSKAFPPLHCRTGRSVGTPEPLGSRPGVPGGPPLEGTLDFLMAAEADGHRNTPPLQRCRAKERHEGRSVGIQGRARTGQRTGKAPL